MPMILRTSGPSPFGRKVKLAAAILDLTDQITIEPANTMDPKDTLRRQNPLGKIPTLLLDDGRVLYDSRVILEYLDALAGGGKIIPKDRDARFDALTLAALADGIMDAALLILYENRYRPDQEPYAPWIELQRDKIKRGLTTLESNVPANEPVTIGSISLACALGHLDFRKQVDWRATCPNLIAWVEDFAARVPAHDETIPS